MKHPLKPLSIRIPAKLKAELQAAADDNGRSLSDEARARLEGSITVDYVRLVIREELGK